MDDGNQPDLDRIRTLAAELAAADPGPAGQLASELAAAVTGLSARIDALWQLILTVVESARLSVPPDGTPQAPIALELASSRRAGHRAVRLSVDGKDWIAAFSPQAPDADPSSCSAIERLVRDCSDQDET